MVTFNISIKIDDIMAESSAVTHLYLDQRYICSLSGENKTFEKGFPVNGKEVSILLKSTYCEESTSRATKNPFKKMVAYFVLFIVNMLSVSEPMECPYECLENIKLSIEGNQPKLSVCLSRNSVAKRPEIFVENKDSLIERTENCFINRSALKEIFSERKKAVAVFSMIPSAILLFLSVLSAFSGQYVTSVFLSLIIVLFFAAFLYSRHHLTNQYRKYLKRADTEK